MQPPSHKTLSAGLFAPSFKPPRMSSSRRSRILLQPALPDEHLGGGAQSDSIAVPTG